jgi:hypothetical protein
MIMHKVTMIVSIPDEHWKAFKDDLKENGKVQFKFKDTTISAEIF